ncbi:unnamed protein product, partial [Amoebophrya sp. A120]|eukprot:GSA120T00000184001.1
MVPPTLLSGSDAVEEMHFSSPPMASADEMVVKPSHSDITSNSEDKIRLYYHQKLSPLLVALTTSCVTEEPKDLVTYVLKWLRRHPGAANGQDYVG